MTEEEDLPSAASAAAASRSLTWRGHQYNMTQVCQSVADKVTGKESRGARRSVVLTEGMNYSSDTLSKGHVNQKFGLVCWCQKTQPFDQTYAHWFFQIHGPLDMPFLSKPVKYKAKKFVFSCTSGQMMSNVGFTETFNCKSEHESHLQCA